MALLDAIAVLKVVRPAMKIVPGIGSILEGGVETLQAACQHVQVRNAIKNRSHSTLIRCSQS